ncbi:unnamed protein product [Linum trigynum]|uniref:Glutathione S-transferase n=1 Tax=Linum trigynum TaxID=586398 RepID=A0AAV2D997_9ROSI
MAEVKLIGAKYSPFCFRLELALKLKGIHEYEYLEQDLINKGPILLHYNPVHKKVPVLVHGENPIIESLAILEYIDETWPSAPSLLPKHPYPRSQARFWAKFADEKCAAGAWDTYWRLKGEKKDKAIEVAIERFEHLEKLIQGKKFFGTGGDDEEEGREERIGYLDLVLGWIPLWVEVMEEIGEMKLLDPQKFPGLCRWGREFVEVPVIKECLPSRETLVQYFTIATPMMRAHFT